MRDRSRQQRNEAHGKTKRSVNSSKRCVIDGFAIVIVLPIVLPTTESPNRSLNCRSDRAWKRGSESKINCTIHRVLQRHGIVMARHGSKQTRGDTFAAADGPKNATTDTKPEIVH